MSKIKVIDTDLWARTDLQGNFLVSGRRFYTLQKARAELIRLSESDLLTYTTLYISDPTPRLVAFIPAKI